MTDEFLLFYLIRKALSLDSADESAPPSLSNIDWENVIKEGRMQAISCVLFEGMCKIVENGESSIDKKLMLKWFSDVMMTEKANLLLNQALSDINQIFSDSGIPFIVMKGQVAASLYPNPMRRQPGDIDVLVYDGYFDKACRILESIGGVIGEVAPEKHTEYIYKKITIELHHSMIDLSNPQALKYISELNISNFTETLTITDFSVPCFTPALNCVYMLSHMVHHLLTEGLGLRQVCDWMLLMKGIECGRFGNIETIRKGILEHLNGFQLRPAYEAFLALGIKNFNLSESIWKSCLSQKSGKNVQKLLRFILNSGNFGRKNKKKKDSHNIGGNFSNALLYLRHIIKMRAIAPSEVKYFFPTRFKRWKNKKR